MVEYIGVASRGAGYFADFKSKMWLAAVCILLAVQGFQIVQGQRKPQWVDTSQIAAGTRINEDIAIGAVVATVRAIDPDGGSITYAISDEAAEYMEINQTNGQIKIKSQLDFERKPYLNIIATARKVSDGQEQSFRSNLQIDDANDNEPQFSETVYNFSLLEI